MHNLSFLIFNTLFRKGFIITSPASETSMGYFPVKQAAHGFFFRKIKNLQHAAEAEIIKTICTDMMPYFLHYLREAMSSSRMLFDAIVTGMGTGGRMTTNVPFLPLLPVPFTIFLLVVL